MAGVYIKVVSDLNCAMNEGVVSSFDLKGKVAVVTGGNGGIGLSMATGLAKAGADIAIWARNSDKNAKAVKTLSTYGVSARAYQVDVADKKTQEAAISATVKEFGGVDIFIANAGMTIRRRLRITPLKNFKK
jgi:2-deoxy-D-gluconate 3-dehydrogenase